jgi:tRNA threonylcarbamoyladenosine biosynthesis protein TsaE
MRESTLILHSDSPDTTRALGAALAHAILRSSANQAIVIALNGELGAGKTTFVSGLLRALGVGGPVRSPTYTLIEMYELNEVNRTVSHLDLYRLADASELEMLAPRDLLESRALLLVEWAERGGHALPVPDLEMMFCYLESKDKADTRAIKVEFHSTVGEALATSLNPVPNETPLSL